MNNLYNIAKNTINHINLKKNGEAGHVACFSYFKNGPKKC